VEGTPAASAAGRARQGVSRALKTGTFGASHLPLTAPADSCEPRLHSFVQPVFTPDPVNTPTHFRRCEMIAQEVSHV